MLLWIFIFWTLHSPSLLLLLLNWPPLWWCLYNFSCGAWQDCTSGSNICTLGPSAHWGLYSFSWSLCMCYTGQRSVEVHKLWLLMLKHCSVHTCACQKLHFLAMALAHLLNWHVFRGWHPFFAVLTHIGLKCGHKSLSMPGITDGRVAKLKQQSRSDHF